MTTDHRTARTAVVARGVSMPSAGSVLRSVRAALRSGVWMEWALLAVVFVAIVGVRTSLGPWQSDDYTRYLQRWSEYLQVHGFSGLGDRFADYNVPYLYLLYIGTLLPADSLTWVKLVAGASDLALAAGCAAVLAHLRLPRHLVVLGAAAVLLLPEVLLNSAAWGQADSTYSALVVWALWGALRNRAMTTWICFALAFTFKLQAAFLLPLFVVAHVGQRWRIAAPAAGVLAALLTEVPAIVAGRSPASLAEVYVNQTNGYQALTLNAPSLYAFLPDAAWAYDLGRSAGLLFAVACVGVVSYAVLRRARAGALAPRTLVLFAVVLGLLAPYTLPQMHERYFYAGNVLLFVLALVDRRLLPLAFAGQAVAVLAYAPFLFGTAPVLPMAALALVEAGIVLTLVVRLMRECGVSLTDRELAQQAALAR